MGYSCYHCNVDFDRAETLFRHIQIAHSDLTHYTCGQAHCERKFQLLYSFKRHITKKHPIEHIVPNIEQNDRAIEPNVAIEDVPDIDIIEHGDIIALPQNEPDNEPDNQPDILNIEAQLAKVVHTFFSRLHSSGTLTRSNIQNITEISTEILCNIGTLLNDVVTPNNDSQENFHRIVSFMNEPFRNQSTEYLRNRYLTTAGFLVLPQKIFLCQRLDIKIVSGKTEYVPVEVSLSFIPLRKLFKIFFEIPNMYNIANTYLHAHNCVEVIDDIAHSNFWKRKKECFGEKFVVPLFVYYDEFECNNPLGSHAGIHKIGAVYVSLRCFPLEFQSRLSNIFLALLVHYQEIVTQGNRVFQVLVDELTFLETEGIELELENGEIRKIYFCLAMILGDNAGLNAILGYTTCSANYFCRFCRGHKRDLLRDMREREVLLRTSANYEDDLRLNHAALTGVKESCIFNSIPSYHVSENNAVDAMHDFAEGVSNYDMVVLLHYFVYVMEMMSLETINNRIQSFDYGCIEMGNKPPIITPEMILRKKHLNFKAAEMICFIRNFGLMCGDLIPEGDDVWSLYTTLCHILDIVLSPRYHVGTGKLLEVLIEEHHTAYIRVCNKIPEYQANALHLKPKYHFVVHYPRILSSVGPIRNFWCMRYEGKHAQAKKIAFNTGSRIDICQTIAVTLQVRLAYSLADGTHMKDSIQKGPIDKVEFPRPFELQSYVAHQWLNCNGHLYKAGRCVLRVGTDNDIPQFGFIIKVLINNEIVQFMYHNIRILSFEEHTHSYVVDGDQLYPENDQHIIALSNLPDSSPLYLRNIGDKYHVTMPYSS